MAEKVIESDSTVHINTKFGISLRETFSISKDLLYLNSGEHGITPKHLIQKKFDYYTLMEKNTDMFVRHLQLDMFEDCKKEISKVLQCDPGSIVFNENSVESLNTILKSMCNNSDGPIMVFDFLNQSSKRICSYHSKYFNIELIEIQTTREVLNSSEKLLSILEEALSNKIPKILVFEHISENSLILPIAEIVQLCKKHGIISVVDGSNSLGQISLNLNQIDASFFILNCHKWWFNPKSLSILYVCKELQSSTHPANISVYNKGDFLQKFRYLGTRDVSSVLCIKDSIIFREKLGETDVQSYIHNLAIDGKNIVKKIWNTRALVERDDLIAGAFTIEIPEGSDSSLLENLEVDLIENHKVYVKLINFKDNTYVRFCCQVINELSEIEECAKIIHKKLTRGV